MLNRARLLARLKPYLRWLPYIGILLPPFLEDKDAAVAKWVIILAAISVQAWKDFVGDAYAEDKLLARLRGHLSTLVDEIEAILGPEFEGAIRANLMRPCDEARLRILCCVCSHKPSELKMRWEIGKGVCGVAYARDRMVYGDLRELSWAESYEELMDETGQVAYGLSEEQWALLETYRRMFGVSIIL